MGSAMSTPNVAARTSPALVMTPPVLARAAVTAASVVAPPARASRIRASRNTL